MPPDHMTSPPMRFENGLETLPPLPPCTRSHCGCRRGQQRHLQRGLEIGVQDSCFQQGGTREAVQQNCKINK